MKPDYEILPFETPGHWREWLAKHHTDTDGVWLRIYKKATDLTTVTHAGALDQALCFGWIDGQRKGYDEISFLQKFTPRRKASLWSKRNIEYIARLTEAGLMMPAGIAEVERAQQDGRWAAAYDRQRDMAMPNDFMLALHKHPKAKEFFETLNKSGTFTIGWQLQTAKTDVTRKRRLDKIIGLLNNQQKP